MREERTFSSILFNIYWNEIILAWNKNYTEGVTVETITKTNILLFRPSIPNS